MIKETLVDVLGGQDGDLTASRRFGGAAMELLWSLARRAPAAVLEANFRPRSQYEREKLLGLSGQIIEVHCVCGLEEAARRFAARAATVSHHAAHPLKALPAELVAEYDRPMRLGQVIEADTTTPVDVLGLAKAIETLWRP